MSELDSRDLPPPKRVLTGRDEAGKSVFKSIDVTPDRGGGDRRQSGTHILRTLHDRGCAAAHRPRTGPDAGGNESLSRPGRYDVSPHLVSAQETRRLDAARAHESSRDDGMLQVICPTCQNVLAGSRMPAAARLLCMGLFSIFWVRAPRRPCGWPAGPGCRARLRQSQLRHGGLHALCDW
jgi:hypothetical protein